MSLTSQVWPHLSPVACLSLERVPSASTEEWRDVRLFTVGLSDATGCLPTPESKLLGSLPIYTISIRVERAPLRSGNHTGEGAHSVTFHPMEGAPEVPRSP